MIRHYRVPFIEHIFQADEIYLIVNTAEGPREAKLAILAKRELGEGVLPEQWADRPLSRHNACVAFAAVEEKEQN